MTERRPEIGAPIDLGASGVRKRLNAFAKYHPLTGERLLDLGCGNGAYTQVLARGYQEVHAVDVTQEHLDLFGKSMAPDLQDRISLHLMAAEKLEFPDNHFDAVSCIEVLEHVTSVDQTVEQVFRVLKPGGAFLITVPNRGFPFETHMVAVGSKRFPGKRLPGLPYIPPIHTRLAEARIYTARSLRRVLTARGFHEVASDHVMPPFDRWEWGRKFVKPLVDRVESTPIRALGVSVVGVYRKP